MPRWRGPAEGRRPDETGAPGMGAGSAFHPGLRLWPCGCGVVPPCPWVVPSCVLVTHGWSHAIVANHDGSVALSSDGSPLAAAGGRPRPLVAVEVDPSAGCCCRPRHQQAQVHHDGRRSPAGRRQRHAPGLSHSLLQGRCCSLLAPEAAETLVSQGWGPYLHAWRGR